MNKNENELKSFNLEGTPFSKMIDLIIVVSKYYLS